MQERTVVKHKLEAKGNADEGELLREFELLRETRVEVRRSDREHWQPKGYGPDDFKREVIAAFTRQGLAELIADAADWLCYVEA
jgi:hypothetical protein